MGRRKNYIPTIYETVFALYDADDNFVDMGTAKYCAEVMGCQPGNIYQKVSVNASGVRDTRRYKKTSTLQVYKVGKILKDDLNDKQTKTFRSRKRLRYKYDLGPRRTGTMYRLMESSPERMGWMSL